jgi:hypothetical protein
MRKARCIDVATTRERIHNASWLSRGRRHRGPIVWSFLCSPITTVAGAAARQPSPRPVYKQLISQDQLEQRPLPNCPAHTRTSIVLSGQSITTSRLPSRDAANLSLATLAAAP